MTEVSRNIDQAQENLLLALSGLENTYPKIVEIITDKIRNDYIQRVQFNEVPGGSGARWPEEVDGEIEPYRNAFFKENLTLPEDRISNLLFISQTQLKHPKEYSTHNLSTFIKKTLSHNKDRQFLEKNIKLADEMISWIRGTDTNLVKHGVFEGTTADQGTQSGLEIFLIEALSRYQEEVSPNLWMDFISDAGKITFEALKEGISPKEIIDILSKKDYLIPLIGAERKLTMEEATELLEKN